MPKRLVWFRYFGGSGNKVNGSLSQLKAVRDGESCGELAFKRLTQVSSGLAFDFYLCVHELRGSLVAKHLVFVLFENSRAQIKQVCFEIRDFLWLTQFPELRGGNGDVYWEALIYFFFAESILRTGELVSKR